MANATRTRMPTFSSAFFVYMTPPRYSRNSMR